MAVEGYTIDVDVEYGRPDGKRASSMLAWDGNLLTMYNVHDLPLHPHGRTRALPPQYHPIMALIFPSPALSP